MVKFKIAAPSHFSQRQVHSGAATLPRLPVNSGWNSCCNKLDALCSYYLHTKSHSNRKWNTQVEGEIVWGLVERKMWWPSDPQNTVICLTSCTALSINKAAGHIQCDCPRCTWFTTFTQCMSTDTHIHYGECQIKSDKEIEAASTTKQL